MGKAAGVNERRFRPPWSAERTPGGYVMKDATGQSLTGGYDSMSLTREGDRPQIKEERVMSALGH